MIGTFPAVVAPKPTPLTLSIKVLKSGKEALLADYAVATTGPSSSGANGNGDAALTELELPKDRFIAEDADAEGWVTFKEPILYI